MFGNDPEEINSIPARISAVTPELVRRTAEQHLDSKTRTVVFLDGNPTLSQFVAGEGKPQ